VIVGDSHGGPEASTSALVWQLLNAFGDQPVRLPRDLSLVFVPEANPDGLANGTRELADGVDPNRNWPTADWTPDTFGPFGEFSSGGGPEPLSEPETLALASFIAQARPLAVVSYHSAGGMVMGGPHAHASGMYGAFVRATGYWASDWVYYPVTGDFAQWCDEDL